MKAESNLKNLENLENSFTDSNKKKNPVHFKEVLVSFESTYQLYLKIIINLLLKRKMIQIWLTTSIN